MNKLLFALFALLNLTLAFSALPTPQQICDNDIKGFNQGVSQLITDILDDQDVWAIFSDLDALDEVSYHLQASCKDYALNLLTKQSPGQNATQYLACGQLVSIVGSLLEEKDLPSFRGSAEGGVLLSQEALGLADLLSKDCKIVLVKEAGEAVAVQTEAEEKDDEDEGEAEEEDDDEAENEEGEVRNLEKKEKEEKKEKKEKKEEKEVKDDDEKDEASDDKDEKSDDKAEGSDDESSESDSSDSSDSDDDSASQGISLKLSDEHDGKDDHFNVKYIPGKKGVPEIVIQHSSEDVDKTEDDSDELDYYLTNLIEITKPGDGDSGQQWKGGDYNKYMNVSDWQTGGFKRFYEAGLGDEEDDDILELNTTVTATTAAPVILYF